MTQKKNASFLWGVHYFRGVAILIIVAVHVWINPLTIKSSEKTDWVGIIREGFFDGSTIYFILISGFLFQYLSSKFELKRYYTGKLKYIILPYVILSSFYLAVNALAGAEKETLGWFFKALPEVLIKGAGQLWYIPFISIVFLFSPLLLRIPEEKRIKYFPYVLLLPLLGTRTGMELTIGQYLYFAPIYVFGMYAYLKFDFLMNLVHRYKYLLLGLLVLMTGCSMYVWYMGIDVEHFRLYKTLVYVRNMIASFYMLYLLEKGRENYKYWLDKIAEYSFALFFTHIFLHYKITMKLLYKISDHLGDVSMFIVSIIYVFLFIFLNLLLCMLLKRILGKYSRYIIGV